MIREIKSTDYNGLMELYLHLHEKTIPDIEDISFTWEHILNDPNYHIIVSEEDGILAASVTCVIIPNLTRNGSPYAFVENVVTHSAHRRKGLASACLEYAKKLAIEKGCYKMMLLTGTKDESIKDFYRSNGYNSEDKTAFIMWL